MVLGAVTTRRPTRPGAAPAGERGAVGGCGKDVGSGAGSGVVVLSANQTPLSVRPWSKTTLREALWGGETGRWMEQRKENGR